MRTDRFMPEIRKDIKLRCVAALVALGLCVAAIHVATGGGSPSPPFRFVRIQHDIGAPSLDAGLTGKPLQIGRTSFPKGVCVQAPARIDLELDRACERFSAMIGVDMSPRLKGEVVFVIALDGREAYRSGILSKELEPVKVDLPLGKAKRMTLIVESAGIVVGDMADWADAKIITRDQRVCFLSDGLRVQGFLEKTRPPDLPPRAGSKICNVRNFGAVGDGRADDAPAFQRALAELSRVAHGVLYIPAGEYRLGSRVEAVLRKADSVRSGLTMRGDGQGVSSVLCDNGDGAIRLSDPACATQFNLHDFSIVALREYCGVMLDLSVPIRGARDYRTLTICNVDIRGEQVRSKNGFRIGIDATGHWRPLFRNVVVRSSRLAEDKDGQCGIRADWCYAPAFEHCYVWGVRTGYSMLCRYAREGPEDASFIRCTAVGCAVGLDIDTPIPEPQLVITACHINCSEVGIRLRNRKFFSITDNLMYSAVPSESEYTDILVEGRSHCGLVAGNIFHFSGRDVYRATPVSKRINIHIGKATRDIVISGNVFNAKGRTILVEASARRIDVKGNHVSNVHARMP